MDVLSYNSHTSVLVAESSIAPKLGRHSTIFVAGMASFHAASLGLPSILIEAVVRFAGNVLIVAWENTTDEHTIVRTKKRKSFLFIRAGDWFAGERSVLRRYTYSKAFCYRLSKHFIGLGKD